MSFKRLRSVNLPLKKQLLIYYTCLNYADQPAELQRKIEALCTKVAKFHSRTLLLVLISENKSLKQIARESYLSERQLQRYRTQFYNEWYGFRKY